MNRNTLAVVLDRMSVPQIAISLKRAAPASLTVLTYHRVAPLDAGRATDEGVVDATPERFDEHLAFVARWFRPISLDDLTAFAAGRAALPSNPLLVTFDDGYRDNHDVALPILLRHRIPATFFLATDFIERRRLFWWDRIALVVKRCHKGRIELDYPERLSVSIEGDSARRAAIRRLQRIVKDRARLDLGRFLDALERATSVTLGRGEEERLVDELIMTWAHVRSLRAAGMAVQSHTRTHRVLQTLDTADLAVELRGSRADLERVLDEPVRALAYPVGRPLDRAAEGAVREAGYELGFSNGTGVNGPGVLDRLAIRRVSTDARMSDAFFRTMLALPRLSY